MERLTLTLTHPPRAGEYDRDKRYTPAWCTEAFPWSDYHSWWSG